ncbi:MULTISPECIES: methyltransferase domain-containing protein [unclassified Bradyrhizobium]|uniref:methyltransferase domain-containing protein n=1 Tax=unclassified Bradyrhizobium TaxID=2631580 RepID=UPI0028EC8186|nr:MULTISPECIES: methyltransferase domain-containing protein [unclassified Bradyrhizobium]
MKVLVDQLYTRAAKEAVPGLCCAPTYDPKYLEIIPAEVIERDYGCGDPTEYVRAGDTVLDLGSGSGKLAFIIAQIVGSEGRVIGIDANASMIELSRNAGPIVSLRIGCRNIEFKRAAIEDMDLDLELVDRHLRANRVGTVEQSIQFERYKRSLRLEHPPIQNGSIDVALSNCVLNLVDGTDRPRVFAAIFRKLRPGGRLVISDIVCDTTVPVDIAVDGQLDAECISGAFTVPELTALFGNAGFVATKIFKVGETWREINGAAFRSMTFVGFKPLESSAQAEEVPVIYRGPWKCVEDDRGNLFVRGRRQKMSRDEVALFLSGPYGTDLLGDIAAHDTDPLRGEEAAACCPSPSLSKGCC